MGESRKGIVDVVEQPVLQWSVLGTEAVEVNLVRARADRDLSRSDTVAVRASGEHEL